MLPSPEVKYLMSRAPLKVSDGADFFELRALEYGEPPGMDHGDLRLGVSVRFDGIADAYDQVWIAASDWRGFILALKRVEQERKGEASLLSISPGEFELRLRIVNVKGHPVAYGHLSRYHFLPSLPTIRSSVPYYVKVDPSMLRELVDSFLELGQR